MTKPLPRIGYVPYSEALTAPGDRRRFVSYAKSRGLVFETAEPGRPYDLVVLSGLADITNWSRYPDGKVVYELINSYLSEPRHSLKRVLRGSYKFLSGAHGRLEFDFQQSVRAMCRRADAVICSTPEQLTEIARYCSNVHTILDIHSDVARTRKADYRAGVPFKIAWEGLTSNLRQLATIRETLNELARWRPTELHVVTDLTMSRYFHQMGQIETQTVVDKFFDNAKVHAWAQESCAAILSQCDLAIIPIDLADPFTTGKPENKLVLLWKVGMPVLTSATPAYTRAMAGAGLDGVCRTSADWFHAIGAMMTSEDLRRDNAVRGYEFAMQAYSDEAIYARWDEVFRSCGFDFTPNG